MLRQAEGPPSTSLDHENGQETVDLATSLTPNDQAGEDAHLAIRGVKPNEEPSGDVDGAIVLVCELQFLNIILE